MICLNEAEIAHFRDTLALLLVVHSAHPAPDLRKRALEILEADGATDTENAQVILLGRLIRMGEKFL